MATASDGDTDRIVAPGLLTGRVVVVTGAARGLGLPVAVGLADAGAAVGVVDREGTAAVAGAIVGAGGRAVALDAPTETLEEVSDALARVTQALGPVAAVVHASVDPDALAPSPIADTADTDWDRRCEAPLRGALACAQAALAQFHDRGGRLVFVTPTVSLTGAAGLVAYTTALEGIRALAKSAARQWGSRGITVNCVAPPLELVAADGRGASEPTVGEPALGRLPDPRMDVAPIVAWLAGPGAGFVTGLTVTVDGGIVMVP